MFKFTSMFEENHYHEHSTTVTEKRAATDESVKLLNEFEEKAQKNIVGKVVLENNLFEGVGILFEDMVSDRYILRIRFIINGKELSFTKEIKSSTFRRHILIGGEDAQKFIKENLVTYFADEIVKKFWEDDKEIGKEFYKIKYGNR